MLTSKIITEIIENNSEFSVWANSYNKLFKVDLDKPWNYLWYCYQKARHPLQPFWKVRGETPPLSCVPAEFTVWHFATKFATEIRKALNVNHFYAESRDPSYVGSTMCPECPGKDLARQALLAKPMGERPRVHPWTRWSNYISNLAWSRLGVEPTELSEIAVDCEVSWVQLWLLAPRPSQEEKRARRWIFEAQCMIRHRSSHLPHYASFYISFLWQQESSVCLKMPSVAACCAQCGRLCGNFHVAIISNTWWPETILWRLSLKRYLHFRLKH